MCYGTAMINLGLCRHLGGEYCQCAETDKEGCGLAKWWSEHMEDDPPDTEESYSIKDPRLDTAEGPQSPLKAAENDQIGLGAEMWEPLASTADDNPPGEESFQKFKTRLEHGLPFVTIQKPGEELLKKSKSEILKMDSDTFIYQWLCIAETEGTDENACA